MAEINLLPLQQQFIKLAAKVERMDRDLTDLRERVEEVFILTGQRLDEMTAHVDEAFAKIEASNANVTALLEELLRRRTPD
jgi:hypothetical protein